MNIANIMLVLVLITIGFILYLPVYVEGGSRGDVWIIVNYGLVFILGIGFLMAFFSIMRYLIDFFK